MLAFESRSQKELPAFITIPSHLFDYWGWQISTATPTNINDIRIAGMAVSKVLTNGSAKPVVMQFISQTVLTELLDIMTQKLLTKMRSSSLE
jgi:hypothetical protein